MIATIALAVVPLGCDKLRGDQESAAPDDSADGAKKKKKKKTDAASSASAATAVTAPASASSAPPSAEPPAAPGPTATIPAGTLRAGAACGAVPRITNEELVLAPFELGEFSIDVHPYPNDPTQPVRTGVTKAEAEGLCQAQSKRLCTELEWERACKGPENATFEYAGNYDKTACQPPADLKPGQRDKCKSAFGVRDLHGLAFEWTSSSWGRGQGSGLTTTRGFKGSNNVVRERCASGQGRDPGKGFGDVGFRCCSGPTNVAAVDLQLSRLSPLIEDASVGDSMSRDLLKAMPPDHREVDGATVSFDRVWRWHPRDNEELLVGRWTGRMKEGGARFHEIAVFKVCAGVATRVARMRGPTSALEPPREDGSPEKLKIDVTTEGDRGNVVLSYWHGSVALTEPEWIKAGNKLDEEKKRPKIIRLPKARPKLR